MQEIPMKLYHACILKDTLELILHVILQNWNNGHAETSK